MKANIFIKPIITLAIIFSAFTSYSQVLRVKFAASDTTFCYPKCVDFTDLTTGSPSSWLWTFNGGSPSSSTDQNPTNICYNTPGNYDVKLIVSDTINGGHTSTLSVKEYIVAKDCSQPLLNNFTVSDS